MKSPWEARVGKLLDPAVDRGFVWAFKPYDSGAYGGQPRIDFIACDILGRCWLVEVKNLPESRRTFGLLTDITPGQRAALDAVSESLSGVALLAVGHGTTLYVFDWREIAWLLTPENPGSPYLPFDAALITYEWSGPKKWQHLLFTDYNERRPSLAGVLTPPVGP